MHQFTAARAEQHRAHMTSAAAQARVQRTARATRGRRWAMWRRSPVVPRPHTVNVRAVSPVPAPSPAA